MPKVLLIALKKIIIITIAALFAVSMALFISPGKIYGAVLVTKITVTSAGGAITVARGATLQMSAAVLPADASNQILIWSVVDDTGSASINESGLLTGTGNGTVYVFSVATDGSGKSGVSIITVTEPPLVLVNSITVTGAAGAVTVLNGNTLQISAEILPADATNKAVTWSVVNGTGSASINSAGLLTGTGTGTLTVRATASDSSAVINTLEVTVNAPPPILVTSITVSGAAGAVTVLNGSTLQMSAEVLPADAANKAVTWSVVNVTGSASINTSGLLTGTGPGTVTVKATASDSSAVMNTLEITITSPPAPPSPSPPAPVPSPSASSSASSLSFLSSEVYEKTATGFVTLFYNRILGRAPDAEGQNGWVSGLAGGALTCADLVRGFIFSEENKLMTSGDTDEQFLTSLYRLVFNRVPDEGGLKSWLASMSAGMTREEVINYFTSCTEFISLCSKYGVRP